MPTERNGRDRVSPLGCLFLPSSSSLSFTNYASLLPSRKEEEQTVGAVYCKNIEDLLQQSDFVMLVVTLTPETHKLIGERELGLMKPTATLINISRGRVYDCPPVIFCCSNS